MKQYQLILPLAGAIALTGSQLPALGQIVPDNSLGAESSVVVPNQNIRGLQSDRIDGGAIRSGNLFHSFQEFNVGDGAGVYFSNPGGVENIFGRVTGSNISNILGTLGVLGNANLFLLNPNGIFFGPKARLDVGGSFFASSATGILFDGGSEFAATNSQGEPLLTVNIPVGLQFRQPPGAVEARGATLAVPPAETLGLLGGDLGLEATTISAPAGRVELGSVGGGGLVDLTFGGNGFALAYDGAAFQNIRLAGDTLVDAAGGAIQVRGGQVSLEASKIRSVTVGGAPGGHISVGATESLTLTGLGFEPWRQLRERIFDGQIDLAAEPGLYGLVGGTQDAGDAGNITVNSPSLNLASGAVIINPTLAAGAAGDINVNAGNVKLVGSSISSLTGPGSTGRGGNMAIATEDLLLRDKSELFAPTFGAGAGGAIDIDAANAVTADDSLISTAAPIGSTGNSGNISLDAGQLVLRNTSRISTTTAGTGSGGNIEVRAAESLTLTGTGLDNLQSVKNDILFNKTQLLTEERVNGLIAGTQGAAASGSISVTAPSLNLENGAAIISPTLGAGDAGEISLNAGSIQAEASLISTLAAENSTGNGGGIAIATDNLLLRDNSELFAPIFGLGAGGDIKIDATNAVAAENSLISTASARGSIGDAGSITINTGRLRVAGRSRLSTTASGAGAGGDINIRASESVTIAGTGFENLAAVRREVLTGEFSLLVDRRVNGLIAGTELQAKDSGDITVTAPTMNLTEGAVIFGPTLGPGAGGNITVNADSLNLSASSISTPASLGSGGKAGDIAINAQQLLLREDSQLFAPTFGAGAGGNIAVSGSRATVDRSLISAAATPDATARAGNIEIDTGELIVRGRSRISTTTSGRAAGGDINIRASESVTLAGTGFGNWREVRERILEGDFNLLRDEGVSGLIAGTEGKGDAGNISVTTMGLVLENGAVILSPTLGRGRGGSIAIDAGNLNASGSSISTVAATGSRGKAGDIAINAQQLLLREESELFAPTFGPGAGGNITVDASSATVDRSLISAAATVEATGNGGNIDIEAGELAVRGQSRISTTTSGQGDGGNIDIRASESVRLSGTGFENLQQVRERILNQNFSLLVDEDASGLIAGTEGKGNAGNITVSAPRVALENGAVILSPTLRLGPGGIITVNAESFEAVASELSTVASAGSEGRAGEITIDAGELLARDRSSITVTSEGIGEAGSINIEARRVLLEDGASLRAETRAGEGNILPKAGDVILRGNSDITTNARERATGGNINIDAQNLISLQDSDITANAEESFGGRVTVNASGIFGTEFRLVETLRSDITATSELGPAFSGTIELNTPEVDPAAGLVELPQEVVDPAALIAQDPCRQGDRSEFAITGKGGLPPEPNQSANSQGARIDLVEPVAPPSPVGQASRLSAPPSPPPSAIQPARGWVRDANGDLILVGYDPTGESPARQGQNFGSCPPAL